MGAAVITDQKPETKTAKRKREKAERVALAKQRRDWKEASDKAAEERKRNAVSRLTCSPYWADTKIHGAKIQRKDLANHRVYPDVPCYCEGCQARRLWPGNAYVGSRGIGFECYIEKAEIDPELQDALIFDETADGASASSEGIGSARYYGAIVVDQTDRRSTMSEEDRAWEKEKRRLKARAAKKARLENPKPASTA